MIRRSFVTREHWPEAEAGNALVKGMNPYSGNFEKGWFPEIFLKICTNALLPLKKDKSKLKIDSFIKNAAHKHRYFLSLKGRRKCVGNRVKRWRGLPLVTKGEDDQDFKVTDKEAPKVHETK